MINKAQSNVLIFGDDMRIFLSMARAFGRTGKQVHAVPVEMKQPALKSKYVYKIHNIPDYAVSPAEWCEGVSKLLAENSFDLIIPCADPVIIAMDRHREIFKGQNLSLPKPESWDVFFDKQITHETCKALDIPSSPAARVGNNDTANSLIERFGLPVVIKPRQSYWPDQLEVKEKVEIIETREHLEMVLEKLKIRSRFLVESYFEGSGMGISVLADNGRIAQAFQHRRLREGRGGCSSYRISEEPLPEMLKACEKICALTRHSGVCMFEFRRNRQTGKWVLLEINARFWGSMPLPISIGVDFPNLLYDLLVRNVRHKPRAYKLNVRSRNFVLDGYNLVNHGLSGRNLFGWLIDVAGYLGQPIGWLTGAEKSDSLVSDDLRPAFYEFIALPFGIVKKIYSLHNGDNQNQSASTEINQKNA